MAYIRPGCLGSRNRYFARFMEADQTIRIAHVTAEHPESAVAQLIAAIDQPEMAGVIFFCSSRYDTEALASAIRRGYGEVPVAGCTTAGELGPLGMRDFSLVGASFSAKAFRIGGGLVTDLQNTGPAELQKFARQQLNAAAERNGAGRAAAGFGYLLIDGLSRNEESVCSVLQTELGDIPLLGGSAGDDLKFQRTQVFFQGRFHDDAAVLLLVDTTLPYRIFRAQHFQPSAERLVVTAADTGQRLVHEINGLPAAGEYARLIGVAPDALGPAVFAANPVVVMIDGNHYVRSIQAANADGSLAFYCAIDEGLVLRIARGRDFSQNLADSFAAVTREIGKPLLTLACDCVLRKLEAVAGDAAETVNRIFAENRVMGFNGYGEQFRGIHINQTFVAAAIGSSPAEASDA